MGLVKMSAKGQLVVPEEIREKESFESGDRFIAVAVEDGVVFKRINIRAEFERVSKQIGEKFRKAGVTKKTIDEAVRWARQKQS